MLPHGESTSAGEVQRYHAVVTVDVSVTSTTAATSFHGSSSMEMNLTS